MPYSDVPTHLECYRGNDPVAVPLQASTAKAETACPDLRSRKLIMLSTLESDRAHVVALAAQILDLENSISALRVEQAQVQSRLDSYKYPVLTLPTEIVTQIFIRVLPPYPGYLSLTGTLSPTSLTHLCHQWREIAISTPSLWRTIDLSDNNIPLEQRVNIFSLWSERSRSCPLSVEFDGEDGINSMSEVMALIAPQRTRLEHLKLGIFPSHLPAIKNSMPVLHHLHLELRNPRSGSEIKPTPFCGLPLLRSVVLNDLAASWVTLPWTQLTSLGLYWIHIHECVPVLQQTSNLIHCELRLCHSRRVHGSMIILPSLESLVLNGPDYIQPIMECLRYFITPSLRLLAIHERLLGKDPARSLTEFVSKSGGNIREVCITGKRSVPETSYRDALQSVPRLYFSHPDSE
ncbi:F-box domain-containing protein [Mycena sanguinolenta]|uniref:F-box domain-containing protein n=1 Tax=Mycena sanguinolenta TaxID=230812 RepID=A0A8H7DKH8_9AGAR|nr:F-box domain-containing protein [Mycena sanguinolenta]